SLGEDVELAPYAVVGNEVEVGDRCRIGSGAQIAGPTVLGPDNRIFSHACIGFDPQDKKYQGERTVLEVGRGNVFREFCTVHRGTGLGGGVTSIGDGNLLMAYVHVAHDCRLGNETILANNATLAGHVEVHDHATLAAFGGVQQFCRIGRYAYVGGYTVITIDVLPFSRAVGIKAAFLGLNRVGLERKDFSREQMRRVEAALRLLVRAGLNATQALERLRAEHAGDEHVDYLIDFVASAERGFIKALPGRRGARGEGGESAR
ncbi:MAG: acyl-ACP--UDP-N-acetylglucosamine O-acyltransferase, partial [Thermoanaerobaculia bacterium]